MNLSDGNGVTDTTTNTLKIESVGKSNEGKYTCDVTNVAGVTTTSNTLQLTVRKCLFLLCLINFYLLCVCVYVCVCVCVCEPMHACVCVCVVCACVHRCVQYACILIDSLVSIWRNIAMNRSFSPIV